MEIKGSWGREEEYWSAVEGRWVEGEFLRQRDVDRYVH